MFESGRRSFWKYTPGKAESVRLDLNLVEANNKTFNQFWYGNIIQAKSHFSSHSLPSVTDDSNNDYGYAEESYVDNSEAFSDTFPRGFRTELRGFYINAGKLKLIPLFPPVTQEKKRVKKKFPNLKNMTKKKKRDAKQTILLKELKKMKFPLLLKHKELTPGTIQNKNSNVNTLASSQMLSKATTNAETRNYAELTHTTKHSFH